MARKSRTVYPKKKQKGTPAPVREQITPPTVAVIDNRAGLGRPGIVVGMRVRILGTGLYAGEIAKVEKLAGGPIPAASVRTEGGQTRMVRTIDLEAVSAEAGKRGAESSPTTPADEGPAAD